MSKSILPLFDKSLQTTAIWLEEIEREIGPDRAFTWRVLSVVLQNLRDRMTVELLAHFGAQLPLVIRGTFYDQFDPTGLPRKTHSAEEFLADIAEGLKNTRGVNPREATQAVFGVLRRHMSEGQIENVINALPQGIRQMWPEAQLTE